MVGKRTGAKTPALEWIAAAIGLALLGFVAFVMVREALHGDTSQIAAIEVAALRIAPAGSGYVVEFEARNRTKGAAAAVAIEGTLKSGDAEIESSTATLDYVPGQGRVTGGLFFTRDPRKASLELRALGFQRP